MRGLRLFWTFTGIPAAGAAPVMSLWEVEPVTGLVLVLHLPVAAVEGLILGFTVPYLMRVRPDLLHARRAASGCAEGEQLVERDLPLP